MSVGGNNCCFDDYTVVIVVLNHPSSTTGIARIMVCTAHQLATTVIVSRLEDSGLTPVLLRNGVKPIVLPWRRLVSSHNRWYNISARASKR